MDFTKKNGVLVPKERLFAPMLSTFGGGSARGFNPGGGVSFPAFYAPRINTISVSESFSTANIMSSNWGYGGGNADGGVINWSGTGTYTITALSIGSAYNTSSPNSAGVRVRIASGTSLSGTAIHTETVPFQNIYYGSSSGRVVEIPLSYEDFTLNLGTNYSVAFGFVTTDLPNYQTFALGSSDGYITSLSISDEYGGGTISYSDTTFNSSDPFDASNGTTFSSNNGQGQIPIFGLQRLT